LAHIAAASLAGLAGIGIALQHRQLAWSQAGLLAGLWALVGLISWLLGGFTVLS
jgi:hypothetical protein